MNVTVTTPALLLMCFSMTGCLDPNPADPRRCGRQSSQCDVDGDGSFSLETGGADCNDLNADIHPGQAEIPYDGVDQDCSDGDLIDVDQDGSVGVAASGSDCDDTREDIYPGASEIPYDAIDQDCSGYDLTDLDGDGFDGPNATGEDCNDDNPAINPQAEEVPYDGVDQDCSGRDLTDVDNDNYNGTEAGGQDCDDLDPEIHPNAYDLPGDGINSNCSHDEDIISTFAGGDASGYSGDGGLSVDALINDPVEVYCSIQNYVYFVESGNQIVRVVGGSGYIDTYAGGGSDSTPADGTDASLLSLTAPQAVLFNPSRELFVSDGGGHRIWKVGTSSQLTLIAGTGESGGTVETEADPKNSSLSFPAGMAIMPDESLLVAELEGNRIRKINKQATVITVFAGNGTAGGGGDGGEALLAELDGPTGIFLNEAGELYVTESVGNRIRKIDASGFITRISGQVAGTEGYSVDGTSALEASLNQPTGILQTPTGILIFSDTGNHRVRAIDNDGNLLTVAGTGDPSGEIGDGGSAQAASLNRPYGISLSANDELFISDRGHHRIRVVSP